MKRILVYCADVNGDIVSSVFGDFPSPDAAIAEHRRQSPDLHAAFDADNAEEQGLDSIAWAILPEDASAPPSPDAGSTAFWEWYGETFDRERFMP